MLHAIKLFEQPALRTSRVRRWLGHLFREWTVESWRPIAPASQKPEPSKWSGAQITLAWLGHGTVLINFFGVTILTDPVLYPRVGIRFPGFTIGPKRLTAPALNFQELPNIDLVLISHAHFDHLDLRTLRCFEGATSIITARSTKDLLKGTHFSDVSELRWGASKTLNTAAGEIAITAFPVKHWGARMQRDTHRGYNGYLIERSRHRIIFAGDTAMTETFGELRRHGAIEVAIMSIGAYNPWIQSHCTPEQAIQMATAAGARFIVPVHHQTFRLSFEPFREPIERFEAALNKTPERIALREIGQTFVLPL
ncbi:MAG TPA: MBL fold metallo-hydrolase [Candidatus Udaeobacter sp.]|jgi:L-ascorbate metabolism protein UlaG (beta-lactamase superfamily)|nr:MBL fold metallo-hydrolase [Candidatus Udaeobacter sp.]